MIDYTFKGCRKTEWFISCCDNSQSLYDNTCAYICCDFNQNEKILRQAFSGNETI